MNLTVEIPDDLAGRLSDSGEADLSRQVLESFGLEQYRIERISRAELRRLLGFETRYELDGFLKAHQVWAKNTIEDLRRDMEDLKSLGI